MTMKRREFIKITLSGTALLVAGFVGIDKLPIFKPDYPPVAITHEDVIRARDFWEHCDIKCPKMEAAFDKVLAGPITPQSQHELKIAICRNIASNARTIGHAFNDPMFADIAAECDSVAKAG